MQYILQLTTSDLAFDFTISYYAQVSATDGSDINTWAYSLDSGETWTDFTTQRGGTTATTWTQYTVSQNVSVGAGSIWFRNILSGATANNRNADFDTFAVTAEVPEPVNVALGVFGLCAVVVGVGRRYLRKRS